MKKQLLLLVMVIGVVLFSCTPKDPNLVTITGKITNPVDENVAFIGSDTTYTATTAPDGTFTVTFSLDSAAYFSFKHGIETTAMYILPGETIELTIDPEMFDETISYTGSPASSFLAEKYLLSESFDFMDDLFYLGSQEEYAAHVNNYKEEIFEKFSAVTDTSFIRKEKEKVEQMLSYYLKRQEQQAQKLAEYGEDVKVFYMKRVKLDREKGLYNKLKSMDYNAFKEELDNYKETLLAYLKEVSDKAYVKKQKKAIDKNIKSWDDRKKMIEAVPKKGEKAIGFTYPDKTGKEFSLESFRGKLVYVDVWATWCGPCKGEIPYLQKLEKEYHGKEIVFVSISTDGDRDAWLKMIEEKNMGGIQLHAGREWKDGQMTGISHDYAILGIPHFLLFSKDGKVISNDAPRPSSGKAIRTLIDENL